MSLQKEIKLLESMPLSDVDMNYITKGAPLIHYENINTQYKNLGDMCGENGCIIFYPIKDRMNGHYIACWIDNTPGRNGRTFHYFDSYGMNVANNILNSPHLLSHDNKSVVNALPKLVTDWVIQGGFVVWNKTPFQCLKCPNIATCGRWAAVRLKYKHLNDTEFKNLMQLPVKDKPLTPDQLVTLMTILV